MTNKEVLELFKERYPELEVDDYRPLSEIFVPHDREGITIWLKNGDILQYFPNTEKSKEWKRELTSEDAISLLETQIQLFENGKEHTDERALIYVEQYIEALQIGIAAIEDLKAIREQTEMDFLRTGFAPDFKRPWLNK